ncbi:hypothetical protein Tco_1531406 [Tanacetum coccineum]
MSDEALREYCDKNYHQILPIIAEKVHQEKVHQEKLKAVKAYLNFEEASQHSESGTPSRRRDLKERLGPRHTRSVPGSLKPRRGHTESPRKRGPERKTVFKRLEKGVFHRLEDKEKSASAHLRDSRRRPYHESKGSAGGHWKSKPKRQKSSVEDDLSQPWVCEETDPFIPRIRYFDFPKTRMPSHIKTYDGTRSRTKAKLQEGRLPKSTKAGAEARQFHGEVGHTTDECIHLKRQIEKMLKAEKLSHLIKDLKQSNGKDQAKVAKKQETLGKDNPLAILMVQLWQKVARQKITQTFSPESVISFPPLGEEDGTEGPMIIEAEIGGHCVHRMYVDGGSFSKILYERCFNRFCPEIGDEEHSTSAWMNFMVVRSPSPNNGIIGRSGVRRIRAVPSTAHIMLKFPVICGTVTLRSNKIIPPECIMVSGPGVPQPVINQATEEKIQVAIHPEYPEQTIAIGSTLTEEGRKELCGLLRHNLDIFSWKPADMTRVPRHIAEHRLNICEGRLLIRQKRGQAPERNKAIYEEVEKLVDDDIMKEVHYHSWLSNPVMVKKHDGSWRMCVDFKDLNKACLKDGYPLPEIDWKVESLCGYHFKCLLDAYKGYHQIKWQKRMRKRQNSSQAKEYFVT